MLVTTPKGCGFNVSIKKIELCTMSNNAIEKLGCPANNQSNCNDILIVHTESDWAKDILSFAPIYTTIEDIKKGKANGGSIILFDLKNTKKIGEIKYKDIFNSPGCSSLDNNEHFVKILPNKTTITETKNNLHLNLICSNKNKIIQYDLIKKECTVKEKKPAQEYRPYKMSLICGDPIGCNGSIIKHEAYRVSIEKQKLCITYKDTQKKVYIDLAKNMHLCSIFVSNKIGSRCLVIQNLIRGNGVRQTFLYDIETGKCRAYIDNLNKDDRLLDSIKDITFGKNDDFMLLTYEHALRLYDLKLFKPKAISTFKNSIGWKGASIAYFSSDDKQIVLLLNNRIYIYENPLAKVEATDEPERIEYLQKEKCPKSCGEKEFFIKIGSIKIKVDKPFLFS